MSAFGFDNVADAQGSSPALLQAYLAAARKISAVRRRRSAHRDGQRHLFRRQDLSQDVHLDGLPLGTVGGMRATHTFPVDGEYEFQVRLYRTNLSAIRGLEDPHELELTLDGEPILSRVDWRREGSDRAADEPDRHVGRASKPRAFASRAFVKAGQRDVAAAFLDADAAALRDQSAAALHSRLREPLRCRRRAARPVDHHSRAVQREDGRRRRRARVSSSAGRPKALAEGAACARRILSTLATRAYRRPISDAEIADLLTFYTQAEAERLIRGRHSVRSAAHPRESVLRVPAGSASRHRLPPAPPYRITDIELASRLSFFFWSSTPRRAAAARSRATGRLRQPDGARGAGHADAGRSALIGVRQQLRRAVAAPAQPARHRAELGPVPRFRRQPAPGVPARGRALLREHRARGPQRARL